MKKNVVGNIIAPKQTEKNWFKRLDILPRLLCLLLALIVWLLVVNVQGVESQEKTNDPAGFTEVLP